jgi:hypothetical protein
VRSKLVQSVAVELENTRPGEVMAGKVQLQVQSTVPYAGSSGVPFPASDANPDVVDTAQYIYNRGIKGS